MQMHAWNEDNVRLPDLRRKPVYIFGEPGLEKDEIAALIHFGSARRRQPMAHIDCAQLNVGRADDLLGTKGSLGLLRQLNGGTLLLNNVHQVHTHTLPHLLAHERRSLRQGVVSHVVLFG